MRRRTLASCTRWLVAAAAKPGLSAETRAHFAEAAETLGEALKAPLIRTGV